jgi:DNA mismatch repair protein MutL
MNMAKIKILPEILSNQIAAGEVVERPVSVVKELVENAIDAGATDIAVEIERGGKSLIRISDNGCGMSRDDALLSIERYATSKIFSKEDLFSISTMGFRGEALPSISSVSKFCIVSRSAESNIGTRIEMVGGKLRDVSDIGTPVGTMVEVRSLFFNTPARKKFLKSDQTEVSHIADVMSGIALGHETIRFRLFFNGKLYRSFSRQEDLYQRSITVLGRDVSGKLLPLEYRDEAINISGYVVNPQVTRSTASKIFLFVNQRLVQERGLISALFQGYRGRLMKGRYPMGVIFINVPFEDVDVNVHPSKREIKFFNQRQVYYTLSQVVSNSLNRESESKRDDGEVKSPHGEVKSPENESFRFDSSVFRSSPKENNRALRYKTGQTDLYKTKQVEQSVMNWEVEPSPTASKTENAGQAVDETENALKTKNRDIHQVFGQVLGTYIIAENSDGLVLIDQHAAHERIVYEQLKTRFKTLDVITQDLVIPETIELSHKEADVLVNMMADLSRLGIVVEPFGGRTFVVKAVPAILDQREVKPIIMDIIEYALINQTDFLKDHWIDEILILMACHNAVRANKSLKGMEISQLLSDLNQCDNPGYCPHGRPISVTLGKSEFDKLFKRVV